MRVSRNITLPPYSPDLNPMVNIPDGLCGSKLNRYVRGRYAAILTARKDAWSFLNGDPDRINSIGHRPRASANL